MPLALPQQTIALTQMPLSLALPLQTITSSPLDFAIPRPNFNFTPPPLPLPLPQQTMTQPGMQLAIPQQTIPLQTSTQPPTRLALPQSTPEDPRSADEQLAELLFNKQQQDRVLQALPASSGDFMLPGFQTQPPALQTFPINKFDFVADHHALGKRGGLSVGVAENAINQYNSANPFNQIDTTGINKDGVHHKEYLHFLTKRMKGKVQILDGADGSLIYDK